MKICLCLRLKFFLVIAFFLKSQFLMTSSVDPIRNISSYTDQSAWKMKYDAREVIENYATIAFLSYQEAWRQALKLQKVINRLVEKPSQDYLNEARNAWINARKAYLMTETFRFYEGPIDFGLEFKEKHLFSGDRKEGPESRINAWPLNENFIDYVQGKNQSGLINNPEIKINRKNILSQDQVSDEAAVTTGWHAIEFLLWGQDLSKFGPGSRSYLDYTTRKNFKRRGIYLKTVTDLLVDDLHWLVKSWKSTHKNSYRYWFEKLPQEEAIGRILTGLATLAGFELASERLGVALDSRDQENEQSCFSDTTQQDLFFDFQGMMNVYFGFYQTHRGVGLSDLLAETIPSLDKKIRNVFLVTSALIASLHQPFDQLILKDPQTEERMIAEEVYKNLFQLTDHLKEVGKILGAKVIVASE